ncbi:ABC transporter substrate-binding protein [Brachybacterium sp. DNPG3]
MVLSRRTLVRSLTAGALGSAALPVLAACDALSGPAGPDSDSPTSTAPATPTEPLVLGQIGSSVGWTAAVEGTIALAVGQALIDVNATYGGVFGQPVVTAGTRHVVEDVDEDLAGVVDELAAAGAGAVICSLPEEVMLTAAPLLAAAGIAVIDVTTSSLELREPSVETAGMLVRLSPSTRVIAARLAGEALEDSSSARAGERGSVAVVHDGTMLAVDLIARLSTILAPQGGEVILQDTLPAAALAEEVSALAATLAEAHPALLLIHGSAADSAALAAAVHTATLGDDGRTDQQIPVRIAPAATVDQRDADLGEAALAQVSGWMPGGELGDAHIRMMLNVDPTLARSAFPYSQLAYDAVMIACIAAQSALSGRGTDIAAAIPQVLSGSADCDSLGSCSTEIDARRRAGETASIAYTGVMGSLVLGPDLDPASGSLRTYGYADDGSLTLLGDTAYEDEG